MRWAAGRPRDVGPARSRPNVEGYVVSTILAVLASLLLAPAVFGGFRLFGIWHARARGLAPPPEQIVTVAFRRTLFVLAQALTSMIILWAIRRHGG